MRPAKLLLPVAATAALALAPAAQADDSLLSGYGGPGAGEQAVIGGGVHGSSSSSGSGGGGGAGSSSSGGGSSAGATAGSSSAPGGGASTGTAAGGPTQGGSESSGGTASPRAERQRVAREAGVGTGRASDPAELPTVSGQTASSGFPLSGGELALGLAAILALVLCALGLRRLAREQRRRDTNDWLASRQTGP